MPGRSRRAQASRHAAPVLSTLTLSGLGAVSVMPACDAPDPRGPWAALGFASACAMGSTDGFLRGARPFGLVEAT